MCKRFLSRGRLRPRTGKSEEGYVVPATQCRKLYNLADKDNNVEVDVRDRQIRRRGVARSPESDAVGRKTAPGV